MAEIGLFPLGLVLLPGEHVPLHIFEPRYRELIGECLTLSIPFGILLAEAEEVRPVGTEATVVEVLSRYDDGRLDVMVSGGDRFLVLEQTTGRSFFTARVEPYVDGPDPDPPLPTERDACLEALAQILSLTGDGDREVPEEVLTAPDLGFAVAAFIKLAPDLRQELLEMQSPRERALRVTEELEGAAGLEIRRRDAARRAATNGQVHRD